MDFVTWFLPSFVWLKLVVSYSLMFGRSGMVHKTIPRYLTWFFCSTIFSAKSILMSLHCNCNEPGDKK